MKILQINIFGNLSTGRIAVDIYKSIKQQGHEGVVAFARNDIAPDVPYIRIGTAKDVVIHGVLTRITDRAGFYSKRATIKLIEDIKAYDPDIIHLHNLHGYYINIEILFNYLAEAGKPVVWTLHDCWAFTGHCAYFDFVGCQKWKSHCEACPNKGEYPKSLLLDRSYHNFEDKRRLFTSVRDMTIITPSNWLAGLVRQSFLNKFPVQVIYNGIDLAVFKPTPSDFRQKHGLGKKTIISAVASTWDMRKGYHDLMRLARLLDKDQQLVIVGLSQKQKRLLPGNVIGILRTKSVKELAELYTAADVFVNPTREETLGLVNIEALACGTPVITYDSGGSPECVDELSGIVLKEKDPHDFLSAIEMAKMLIRENCVGQAHSFNKQERFIEYLRIYEKISKHTDRHGTAH